MPQPCIWPPRELKPSELPRFSFLAHKSCWRAGSVGWEAECKIYSPVFLLSVWIRKIVPCRGMRKSLWRSFLLCSGSKLLRWCLPFAADSEEAAWPLVPEHGSHVGKTLSKAPLASLSFKRCEEMPGTKEAMCPGQIIALQLER